jgi:hypothetical protein
MLTSPQQTYLRRALGVCVVALGALFVAQVARYYSHQRQELQASLAQGRAEAQHAAQAIDAELAELVKLAKGLASDLNQGRLPESEIPARLQKELEAHPAAFQVGIAFAPGRSRSGKRLFAPFVSAGDQGLRHYQVESMYDYTQADWYLESTDSEGWKQPHLSKATGVMVVGYSLPFRLPNSSGPSDGLVRVNLSMEGVRAIISQVHLGTTGYGFLLNDRGQYLADPMDEYVRNEKTIFQVAEEKKDPARKRIGDMALRGEAGQVESISGITGQPVWIFCEPLHTSAWSLGAVFLKDEIAAPPQDLRRAQMNITLSAMALLALAAVLLWRPTPDSLRPYWRWVTVLSLLLVGGIAHLWYLTLAYPDRPRDEGPRIADQASLRRYLETKGLWRIGSSQPRADLLATGFYIQTLRFGGANEVIITGFAWQTLEPKHQGRLEAGILFPDAESSDIKELFRRKQGEKELIGYAVKATLRESFDSNHKYPFDRAVVRVRMWPRGLRPNSLLVPDLNAYQLLTSTSLPGTDKRIVLPGWKLEGSYFGFQNRSYNTDFGLSENSGSSVREELTFNLVLQRKFLDPFISTLLPIFVIAVLLFTLLMASTKIKERVTATGFKATDILRASATLLFPVVYAQINLRSRIASDGLLYLEYFYFAMYTVILLVAANALAFALEEEGFLQRQDNALPKLLFWPVVLGAFFGISLAFLY